MSTNAPPPPSSSSSSSSTTSRMMNPTITTTNNNNNNITNVQPLENNNNNNYQKYIDKAKTRWLTTEEVYDILCNYENMPIRLSSQAPLNPVPGQLYLFNRQNVKLYKKDRVDYIMRKDQPSSVKEEFSALKIKGVKKLSVSYARSKVIIDVVNNLCRRCYKRIDFKDVTPITLVQYFINPIKKRRANTNSKKYNKSKSGKNKKKTTTKKSTTSSFNKNSKGEKKRSMGTKKVNHQQDLTIGGGRSGGMFDVDNDYADNNYNQFNFSNIQNFGIDPNSNNTIEELDMKWDVSDFSFADDEGNDNTNNMLNHSNNSDNNPLYYDIIDYSPEEFHTNNNNSNLKKLHKLIIVTRLAEGSDEPVDLFMQDSDHLYVAIEYGVKMNIQVDLFPLQVLSVDTYKIYIENKKMELYIKSNPDVVIENNNILTGEFNWALIRKQNIKDNFGNKTNQIENIQCSDKFVLKIQYKDEKNIIVNNNNNNSRSRRPNSNQTSVVDNNIIHKKKRSREDRNTTNTSSTTMNNGGWKSSNTDIVDNDDNNNNNTFSSSRQFKVRMIETINRLASGNTKTVGNTSSTGDVGRESLEDMDDEQLHRMSENMVMQVVTQLSDVADKSIDGQLRQDLLAIDENGYNLLHMLCINASSSSIPIILNAISKDGQNAVLTAVNTPTRNGMRPLHLAAMNGSIECVNQLLYAGAILNVHDQNGLNAYDIALRSGHVELAKILKQRQTQQEEENPMIARYIQSLDSPPASYKEKNNQKSQPIYIPSNNNNSNNNNLVPGSINYNAVKTTGQSSPRSPPRSFGEENKAFLADALQNLSLQDKCALKIGLESLEGAGANSELNTTTTSTTVNNTTDIYHANNNTNSFFIGHGGNGIAGTMQQHHHTMSSNNESSCTEDELFSDVASVLSEADIASVISNESGQLDIVISAMNSDEKEIVDEEVVKIQKNVKRWLMQKNFETIRSAAKKLSSTRHAILTRRQFVRKKKAATALQAAARGLRDRREFEQIRQKASATLVINKHVREWLKRKKDETRLETVDEIDDSSSADNNVENRPNHLMPEEMMMMEEDGEENDGIDEL